jgi:hypothetical protein
MTNSFITTAAKILSLLLTVGDVVQPGLGAIDFINRVSIIGKILEAGGTGCQAKDEEYHRQKVSALHQTHR